MSRTTEDQPASLGAWPAAEGAQAAEAAEVTLAGAQQPAQGRRARSRGERAQLTTVTTAKPRFSLREYGQYKELFYNLTLRELRSKYKRSVLGWGWSMVNPLANMAVYTVVFSVLLKIPPMLGVPSDIHVYALMLLCAMLPWNFFMGSVTESMTALLGNQNLIQKTYFPRELIPAATVASKLVSHLIEMGLLIAVIVGFGNWRALAFIPGVIVTMAVVSLFALGLALLFSLGNVFYRDIMHFSNILFFIWMFLTPIAYPYSQVAGGLFFGSGGVPQINPPKFLTLFGHAFGVGTLFKLNPMTDAVLVFQSFIYNGSFPSALHHTAFPVLENVPPETVAGHLIPAHSVVVHAVASNVSWGDFAYLLAWAVAAFVVGLWVFRKYEARLPEEL
jgi:lipopolysaccharide transport system permease protein